MNEPTFLSMPEAEYRELIIELIDTIARLVHRLNKMPGVRARIDIEYMGPHDMRHPPNWPVAQPKPEA